MLASQEHLNRVCPELVLQLRTLIAGVPSLDQEKEAIIYALGQVLHDSIQALDVQLEEKGEVVSMLLENMIEANKTELAVYNELREAVLEQKSRTLH